MHITLSDVEQALNDADVEGLLANGAPRDEYSSEAQAIADRIAGMARTNIREEELISIMADVWERSFGPFSAQEIAARTGGFRWAARTLLKMHSMAAS